MGAQRLEGYGLQILDLGNLNQVNDGDDELLKAQRTAQHKLKQPTRFNRRYKPIVQQSRPVWSGAFL